MSNLIAATVTATTAVKAGSLQDAAGANGSTPEQIQQGRSKAWLNLNGTGTISVRDSFNVSSMLDNGTGDYLVTFAVSRPSANYAFYGAAFDSAGVANRGVVAAPAFSGAIKAADARFSSIAIGVGNTDYDTIMTASDGD